MKLPTHECGLYLEHNAHRDYYQSAADWFEEQSHRECTYDWPNDEAKQRAVATNEIWTLQWYPRTPIGCHMIAAPTLEELLSFAERIEHEDA
jgi:hypothetical protein